MFYYSYGNHVIDDPRHFRSNDNRLGALLFQNFRPWQGDKELETALFHRLNAKKCAVCGALFTPGSNRAKYCPECAARMKRINAAKRKRKQREKCHALGAEKPL